MVNLKKILSLVLFNGTTRTIKLKKNIVAIAILKLINILIGILLVPLTLKYLESSKYGIWLTLSSIVAWVGYFDLGLSNGLRNKLGEAFAKNDFKTSQVLISTTFIILLIIVVILNILFWVINPFLSWGTILNVNISMSQEVNFLVYIVFTFFSFQFLTGLISAVLATDQRPALANSFSVIASLISLLAIYILTLTTKNSLLYLGICLSAISFIVPFFASIMLFNSKYKHIAPKLSKVDFGEIKSLANQGIQFFFLQIASLVLTMTDLLVISRLYGPKEVVPYNIAYRLFGITIIIFGMITSPFWAAYNDAFHKKDFVWIKRVTGKVVKIWCVFVLGVLILIYISNYLYKVWLGDQVYVPLTLSFYMGVYVLLQSLNSIFATFIFATGKLFLLTSISIFVTVINIPLCFIFAVDFNLGSSGVILATIVCTCFNLIVVVLQYSKIVNNKSFGIWSK